jgi:hypothetical protein
MLVAVALFVRVKRNFALLRRSLALMLAGGVIPAAGFFLWFFRVEDFQASVRSVLAAWIPLLTTSAAHGQFYRWCLGMDKPWFHARKIPLRLSIILAVPLALGLLEVSWNFNWFTCGYCLPPVCLTLLAVVIWRAARTGWEPAVIFAFLWTVWSLLVMAKLGLFCRIWHYGFALAMPAFISGFYLLLWALPRQLERCAVRSALFRGLLWLFLLPGLLRLAQTSLVLYADKTMPVGSGADTMLAFDLHFRAIDSDMAAALRWVETNVPPSATLTVLPQGVMLNYLTRHTNPCGYSAWNPPELAAFGQEKMTAALIAHSPDYIIELLINYGEYGETYFGEHKSFGLEAQQWIAAHYRPVLLIGRDRDKSGLSGIKILQKNRAEP